MPSFFFYFKTGLVGVEVMVKSELKSWSES